MKRTETSTSSFKTVHYPRNQGKNLKFKVARLIIHMAALCLCACPFHFDCLFDSHLVRQISGVELCILYNFVP